MENLNSKSNEGLKSAINIAMERDVKIEKPSDLPSADENKKTEKFHSDVITAEKIKEIKKDLGISTNTESIDTAVLKIPKNRAIEKLKEVIARLKTQREETDLNKSYELTSKLTVDELFENGERISVCEEELKSVEAGEINPEALLYKYAELEGRIKMLAEKAEPNSELSKILNIENEFSALTTEETGFIKNYGKILSELNSLDIRLSNSEQQTEKYGEDEFTNWEKSVITQDIVSLNSKRKSMFENMNKYLADREIENPGNRAKFSKILSTYNRFLGLSKCISKQKTYTDAEMISARTNPTIGERDPNNRHRLEEINKLYKIIEGIEIKHFNTEKHP